jgi:hypothetical protein
MTNKEKYPNIDDAMKAFKDHKEKHGCNCTFEKWIDTDEEEMKRGVKKLFSNILTLSIMETLMSDKGKPKHSEESTAETESVENKYWERITDVECPICHGKNTYIRGMIEPMMVCKDCNVAIGKAGVNFGLTVSEFDSFIKELCKKNKKA